MVIPKFDILSFFQNIKSRRPMLTFECFDIVITFATASFTRSIENNNSYRLFLLFFKSRMRLIKFLWAGTK